MTMNLDFTNAKVELTDGKLVISVPVPKTTTKGSLRNPDTLEKYKRLRKAGHNDADISELLNIKVDTLRAYRYRHPEYFADNQVVKTQKEEQESKPTSVPIFSHEVEEKMMDLWEKGHPATKISETLSLNLYAVRKHIRENPDKFPKRLPLTALSHEHLTSKEVDALFKLSAEGYTPMALARYFGVSITSIAYHLRNNI